MAKTEWKDLSKEQLKQKEKSLKIMIGVSIVLILIMLFAVAQSYLTAGDIDWSVLTIAICTVAGPATLYPQWKDVRAELQKRR